MCNQSLAFARATGYTSYLFVSILCKKLFFLSPCHIYIIPVLHFYLSTIALDITLQVVEVDQV